MISSIVRRAVFLLLAAPSAAHAAGEGAAHRLTLQEAAAHAVERHPAIATASSNEAVAAANIEVVRAEATPRVGVVVQLDRATGNVVPGATFAMPGIPGVAGPPGASRFGSGAWQSAVGLTASWDILELVRRPTLVDAAGTEASVARAQSDVTRLLVAARAADAYLVVAEARALVTAAEAGERRTRTFHEVVATIVGQKLRPEVDLARADTELASARALLEKTRLGATVASTKLAEAIGETGWSIEIVDADVAGLPAMSAAPAVVHPAIAVHDVAARAAEARASVARLGRLPKAEIVGAAWLRGGGYVLGGPNSGDAAGVLPDTPNWALGIVTTWAPTDIGAANARARAEAAAAAVQRAEASEVSEALTTEEKTARATVTSMVAVTQETAVAVAAARRALELANARYTSELGNVLDVADSERTLAAAERDDAIARLEAWRAVVAMYRAQGSLGPLVGAAGKAKG